jgi:hypothetical protein
MKDVTSRSMKPVGRLLKKSGWYNKGNEKLDSGYTLKVESTGSADGLDEGIKDLRMIQRFFNISRDSEHWMRSGLEMGE